MRRGIQIVWIVISVFVCKHPAVFKLPQVSMICLSPTRDSSKLRSQGTLGTNRLLQVVPMFPLAPPTANSDAMGRWFRPSLDQVPDGGLSISPSYHALTLGGEEHIHLGSCTLVVCLYLTIRIKQVF